MRVAFLTATPPEFIGGAEVFMERLSKVLKRRGHEIKFFSLATIKLTLSQKLFLSALRYLPYREIYKAKILCSHFNKHAEDFDVVIANDYFGMYAKAPKKIMLLHGYYGDVFDSIKHKISRIYYVWGMQLARIHRMAMKKSDIVVAFSNHTRDYMRKKGLKEPIIIPHGIDTKHFKPIKGARQKISINLPDNFLLYVGSQAPWKNVETVKKISREETVVFLSRETPLCPTIHWIKYVKDEELPLLYNCAEILLHPALHEGFGYVVAEAMACGTPPVFTRTGYGEEIAEEIPEVIIRNPENIDEIKNRISYIREHRVELSKRCRKFIEKNNNLKDWEKKWLELLEQ